MRTAVDTSALSALFGGEAAAERIAVILMQQRRHGGLYICAQVYAELAVRYEGQALRRLLEDLGIAIELETRIEILATAAERWHAYLSRRRGGEPHYPCPNCGQVNGFRCERCRQPLGGPKLMLADFMIGADALHRADVLVALDRGVYRTYFPDLKVIDVETG